MGRYDDLVSIKGSGTPIDNLTPLDDDRVARLRNEFGSIPSDYVSFLLLR